MKKGTSKTFSDNISHTNMSGFTIVELLIIIVVIAILATITAVSYNGTQQRAVETSVKADISSAAIQIEADHAATGSYPVSAPAANGGKGLKNSPENVLSYARNAGTYCVAVTTARAGGMTFHLSSDSRTIQPGECGAVSPVTLVGAISFKNSGLAAIPLNSGGLPAGISNNDLLFAEVQVGQSNRNITDWAAKGWWLITESVVGTREISLFARIYNPSDSSTVYTLTMDGTGQASGVTVALRGHAVTSSSDLIVGNVWIRASNGGSQNLIVAPSVTTTTPGAYALAFFGAATGSATTMTPGGTFALLAERAKDPSPEWPGVFGKSMPTAGATGNQTWTDNAASPTVNGLGVQVAVP